MSIFTATKELAVKVGAETTGSNVTDILNNIAEAYGATKKGGNAEEAINLITDNFSSGAPTGDKAYVRDGAVSEISGEKETPEESEE